MDKITIEILADGTIKTCTDTVGMPNHANAEMFLREMGRLAGGKVERKRKQGSAHVHTHDGVHWHSHDHEHHHH